MTRVLPLTRAMPAFQEFVGPVFRRLAADDHAFAQVRVEPRFNTLCWPGDLDVAPELIEELPDVTESE